MTSSGETAPDVSIVVVNFQGGHAIAACLRSLFEDNTAGREIIVVDNHSSDDSPAIIEKMVNPQDRGRWIASPKNVGYAAAIDLARPLCRGRYIAVLNMDTVVEPGWLDPLVEHLDQHAEVAAASPLILLADGKRVNAAGQWVHRTGLGFNRDLGRPTAEIEADPFPVSGIHGAAFVIRSALIDQIGGIESGGFLYHEDVNLSWLLHLMGYELACVPVSRVRHDYFLSMHPEKLELLERNREAMLRAYLQPKTRRGLIGWRTLTESILWLYSGLRGPRFLRAKWRARAWVHQNQALILQRRKLAERLRIRSDTEVLATTTRSYPLRQVLKLAGERGAPRRPIS